MDIRGPGDKCLDITVKCQTEMKSEGYQIEGGMTVGSIADRFGIKCLEFSCTSSSKNDSGNDVAMKILTETNKKALNAFQIMMAGGRSLFLKRKTSSSGIKGGLSKRDELFNDLVSDFEKRGLDWPRSQVPTDAAYFIQVLTNALLNLTNHHEVINDAANKRQDVKPIPEVFSCYTGYNDTKRKKVKGHQISQSDLDSHSQALYSLLLKPVLKNTPAWNEAFCNFKDLAEIMDSYKNYLKAKLDTQSEAKSPM